MSFSRLTAQDCNGSGSIPYTKSFPSATTSGNLLIAAVQCNCVPANISMSGWTLLLAEKCGTQTACAALFYKISSGDTSLTISSSTGTTCQVQAYEYSGNPNPIIIETYNGTQNSSANSANTGNITTSQSGDLIFVVAAQNTTNGGSTSWTTATNLQANTQTSLMSGQYLPGTTLTGFSDTAHWSTNRASGVVIGAFSLVPITNYVTWTGNASFAAHGVTAGRGVATWSSQAVLSAISPSSAGSGTVTWTSQSAFSAVGLSIKNSTATWTGHTNFPAIGAPLNKGVSTFSPHAVFNSIGKNIFNSVVISSPHAALSFVTKTITNSIATWSPHAALSFIFSTAKKAIWSPSVSFLATGKSLNKLTATWTGQATFSAKGNANIPSTAIFHSANTLSINGIVLKPSPATFTSNGGLTFSSQSLTKGIAGFSPKMSALFSSITHQNSYAIWNPGAIMNYYKTVINPPGSIINAHQKNRGFTASSNRAINAHNKNRLFNSEAL